MSFLKNLLRIFTKQKPADGVAKSKQQSKKVQQPVTTIEEEAKKEDISNKPQSNRVKETAANDIITSGRPSESKVPISYIESKDQVTNVIKESIEQRRTNIPIPEENKEVNEVLKKTITNSTVSVSHDEKKQLEKSSISILESEEASKESFTEMVVNEEKTVIEEPL